MRNTSFAEMHCSLAQSLEVMGDWWSPLILRDLIWSMQLATQTASASDFERLAGIEALKAASVIMAALPMLIAYPFFQRYFVKGIMLGAIKG